MKHSTKCLKTLVLTTAIAMFAVPAMGVSVKDIGNNDQSIDTLSDAAFMLNGNLIARNGDGTGGGNGGGNGNGGGGNGAGAGNGNGGGGNGGGGHGPGDGTGNGGNGPGDGTGNGPGTGVPGEDCQFESTPVENV
jgi:hypothetical protein